MVQGRTLTWDLSPQSGPVGCPEAVSEVDVALMALVCRSAATVEASQAVNRLGWLVGGVSWQGLDLRLLRGPGPEIL